MNDLHARQRAEPDEQFVNHLERQLISHTPASLASTNQLATGMNGHLPVKPAAWEAPARWRYSFLTPAVSMVLLLAIIGGAGFVVWQGGGSDEPRSIAFPSASNGTPVVAAAEATAEKGLLWELPETDVSSISFRPLTVVGDAVFRYVNNAYHFDEVEAIDGRTGQSLWRTPALWADGLAADPQGVYYFAYSPSISGHAPLIGLSAKTGEELWRVGYEGRDPRNMRVYSDRLYIFDLGNVTAIDTVSGQVVWQSDYQSDESTTEQDYFWAGVLDLPIEIDDVVVTFLDGGTLVALDRETGVERWRKGGFHPLATRFAAAGDVLATLAMVEGAGNSETPSSDVAESNQGQFFTIQRVSGVDPSDGSTLWEQHVVSQTLELVALDDVVAVIGDEVVGLDEGNVTDVQSSPGATPSPIATSHDYLKYVRGFDPETGELLWVVNAGEAYFATMGVWKPESGVGGGITITTSDGQLRPVGFWSGGKLTSPSEPVAYHPRPIAGNFGFVVTLASGALAGVEVEQNE